MKEAEEEEEEEWVKGDRDVINCLTSKKTFRLFADPLKHGFSFDGGARLPTRWLAALSRRLLAWRRLLHLPDHPVKTLQYVSPAQYGRRRRRNARNFAYFASYCRRVFTQLWRHVRENLVVRLRPHIIPRWALWYNVSFRSGPATVITGDWLKHDVSVWFSSQSVP